MRFYLLVVIMILFNSCAKVKTIGLEAHRFNANPKHIIWFQIAGLNEEHLALLRYNRDSTYEKTSFEKSTCLGKTWSYNLYDIRPTANNSFKSQLVGSKNITNSCSDYRHKPLWEYTKSLKYQVAVFESGAKTKNSLLASLSCNDGKDFLNDIYMFEMSAPIEGVKEQYYKTGENSPINDPGIYFDKSCKSNNCFSTMEENIRKLYPRFANNKARTVFIIRDFSYLNALKSKNIAKANEILHSIERLYQDFIDVSDKKGETLALITAGESYKLELPRKGREWENYTKAGKGVIYKKSSLVSPVFSYGASSENFCGFYEESAIMKRLLWSPNYAQVVEDIKNLVK